MLSMFCWSKKLSCSRLYSHALAMGQAPAYLFRIKMAKQGQTPQALACSSFLGSKASAARERCEQPAMSARLAGGYTMKTDARLMGHHSQRPAPRCTLQLSWVHVQVLQQGGQAQAHITPETTHLVIVRPPSTSPGDQAVSSSTVQAPARILDAVVQAGGGAPALKALRCGLHLGTCQVLEAG